MNPVLPQSSSPASARARALARRGAGVLAGAVLTSVVLSGCGTISTGGEPSLTAPAGVLESGLPRTQVWSGYGVGTSNYSEQAAVAESLINDFGSQVRILGSDTGMGRLTPLRVGQAQIARLSDEAFYAFEGKYEFLSEDWGPQDLRSVWTPPTTVTVGVRDGEGIETLQDLKGKKVPYFVGNPSSQEKIQGVLAYAGLSENDVTMVPAQYGTQPQMLKDGAIDMVFFGIESSAIIEVATTTPFTWLDFGDGPAAEDRFQERAPSVQMLPYTSSVGMGDAKELHGPTYSILMTTYAQYSTEEVYAMVKAFHEAYPSYENATSTTDLWNFETIDWMPVVIPHHDGLVQYLEEQGVWTPAMEERNQALIARGETLREGWESFKEDVPQEQWASEWEKWKAENAPLPPL
ncbi:TAXI family TRAP transporter solute-binding subunit [Brevibacterium samyangense]|uniref:TAXI family TRAP transporter solute-binding subunit n=1 Tax=Brevibacterium samyangense TaxID=366888 RepID=A0ABN2TAL8_9MICO